MRKIKNNFLYASGVNNYVAYTNEIDNYYEGLKVRLKILSKNTGACTLQLRSDLPVKNIYKNVSVNLVNGDTIDNQIIEVQYDGNAFQVTSALADVLYITP